MGEMAALPRGGVADMVRFREEASPALGLERLPGSCGPRELGRAGHRAPGNFGLQGSVTAHLPVLALPLSLWYPA
jgi:hypothetical protein